MQARPKPRLHNGNKNPFPVQRVVCFNVCSAAYRGIVKSRSCLTVQVFSHGKSAKSSVPPQVQLFGTSARRLELEPSCFQFLNPLNLLDSVGLICCAVVFPPCYLQICLSFSLRALHGFTYTSSAVAFKASLHWVWQSQPKVGKVYFAVSGACP